MNKVFWVVKLEQLCTGSEVKKKLVNHIYINTTNFLYKLLYKSQQIRCNVKADPSAWVDKHYVGRWASISDMKR